MNGTETEIVTLSKKATIKLINIYESVVWEEEYPTDSSIRDSASKAVGAITASFL